MLELPVRVVSETCTVVMVVRTTVTNVVDAWLIVLLTVKTTVDVRVVAETLCAGTVMFVNGGDEAVLNEGGGGTEVCEENVLVDRLPFSTDEDEPVLIEADDKVILWADDVSADDRLVLAEDNEPVLAEVDDTMLAEEDELVLADGDKIVFVEVVDWVGVCGRVHADSALLFCTEEDEAQLVAAVELVIVDSPGTLSCDVFDAESCDAKTVLEEDESEGTGLGDITIVELADAS